MLFYFSKFIINRTKIPLYSIYDLLWSIKLAGNKVWNYANKRVVATRHEAWF